MSSFVVFISHAGTDTWVARQISDHIRNCGAETFLDEGDVQIGDDFEQKILDAARRSDELLVLLTPWSLERPYIWMEIGAHWVRGKRIIGVLHGLTVKELAAKDGVPVLMHKIDLIDINRVDSYLRELRMRIGA